MQRPVPGGDVLGVEQSMSDLRAEIACQVDSPQGEDIRIAACNLALQQTIDTEGLDLILAGTFARRPDLSPVHANRLTVRAFQRPALRMAHEIGFPKRHADERPWVDHQTRVLRDPLLRRQFKHDLHHNSVQTNVADRGKTLKLLAALMPDRFNRPLRIAELGCGTNHIGKKAVLNSHGVGFPYGPVNVKRPAAGEELGSVRAEDDPDTTRRLNLLLVTAQLAIRRYMGLDKVITRHPASVEWARSQYYPSEYMDEFMLEEFDTLQASRPGNVHFMKADILELLDSPDLWRAFMRHGPYDIVFYPNFIYQLSDEGREVADEIGNLATHPEKGIKVYQDFINVDPATGKLVLEEHWDPYTHRTIIEDNKNPGKKETLFVWRRGRIDEVQIGPGVVCVGNELVPAQDLVAA
jgi:hypothetical protein